MEREAWDRMPGEPTKAHAAFRMYRDLPAHQRRLITIADKAEVVERTVRRWAEQWDWRGRATAWDDATHRIEDRERLEAIRSMHSLHRRTGRAALAKAVQALGMLQADDISQGTMLRMMELGAKLERSTLIVSVEELQGLDVTPEPEEDPWDRIARELTPQAPEPEEVGEPDWSALEG
jgi:hypothetical protein